MGDGVGEWVAGDGRLGEGGGVSIDGDNEAGGRCGSGEGGEGGGAVVFLVSDIVGVDEGSGDVEHGDDVRQGEYREMVGIWE